MIDLKITSNGDFIVDKAGDLSLTGEKTSIASTEETEVLAAQMAYMAIKTELSDFVFHPYLGNELKKLLGLPNKPATAAMGEKLIMQALKLWSVPGIITISSYPIELQKIRFEIKIEIGNPPKYVTLTLDQILDEIGAQ
jgi:hypothetical protein